LCCKVDRLQQGLKESALGQAFQDMDNVQLAAYCIAMLAEYVQESWLAELRDIYAVPTSGRDKHVAFLDRSDLRHVSPRIHWFAQPGEMPGS